MKKTLFTICVLLTIGAANAHATALEYRIADRMASELGDPVAWEVDHAIAGQPPTPIHTLSILMFDLVQSPEPVDPTPITMSASDTRTEGRMEIQAAQPPEPSFPTDTFFDLQVEAGSLGDHVVVGIINPEIHDVTAISFGVSFDVLFADGSSAHNELMFHVGTNNTMQPLEFANVSVGQPQSPIFHVLFNLLTTNGADVHFDAPLVVMTVSGHFNASLVGTLIDIDPDTLNRNGNGNWITAYITLPEGFDVADIDPHTIQITSLIGASCDPDYVQAADLSFTPQVGDRDEDGVPDLTVKFDRQLLLYNICLDDVAITVEGHLASGEHFIGSDQIRVIERGRP